MELSVKTVAILVVVAVGLIANVNSLECIECRSDELTECSTLRFTALGNVTQLPTVTCDVTQLECETRVSTDGITLRGCKAPESTCSGPTCSTCIGDRCNGEIFPADRRTCLQCEGTECLTPQTAYACPNYASVDSCYAVFSKDGFTTYRGCSSDAGATYGSRYCDDIRELCIRCSVNGCNTANAIIQDNPLSCVKCDSRTDPNCARLTAQHSATACGLISHGHVDACYTHVADGILHRGCLSEVHLLEDDCKNRGDLCELCTGSGCNTRTVETEVCIECDAEQDASCRGRLEGNSTLNAECPLSLQPLGCYHFDDGGEVLKRGCLSSLTTDEIDMCSRQDAFCKTCTSDSCNALANFQHCQQCHSDDTLSCFFEAATTQSQVCRNYLDVCVVKIANNAVERACADRDIVRTDYCAFPAQCELCEGETNCNAVAVEASDFCYTCDSREDANCRDQLNESMQTQCTFSVGSKGCFREETEDGHVRRGCLNSVPTAVAEQCLEQGDTCKTCTGAYCNEKVEFQRCRECSSNSSTSCFRSPGSFAAVLCSGYLDECFVHLENDVVSRGCVSAASAPIQDRCINGDGEFCETCGHSNNCNNKLIDAEFCMTCDVASEPGCLANANFTMRTQCPLGVGLRGCYLYTDGGDIVKRGCVADLIPEEISMCRRQEDECKTCLGNDCNVKPTFQRCRSCNSTQSVNCIRAGTSFASVTCRLYDDECYTYSDSNSVVTRGCLSDAQVTSEVIQSCQTNGDACATCSDANGCNSRVVDGEFCLECDSTIDPECATNATFTMRKQCPLSPNRVGCYLYDDGGDIVKRGCVADLLTEEIEMCRREGSECKTCVGDDCNAQTRFQSCRTCNSTQTVNCIRSSGAVPTVQCAKYTDECYVNVDNDVVTRGCLAASTLTEEARTVCSEGSDESCQTCGGTSNCNNQLIDGEFCISCDAEVDENCRTNANFTLRKQCPLSVHPVGCFLFTDGGEVLKRGCVADITPDERDFCREQGSECKTCVGNDCNAKAAFQRCRACSSASSVNCIRSPNTFASVECKQYDDSCYVHVLNNTVTRGCLSEATVPDVATSCAAGSTSDLCETCSNENLCNNRIVDGEFCLTCDSTTDPNCAANANFTMRTQCPLSPSPRGCYRFQDGDLVKRGCVADLPQDEIDTCRLEGRNCKTCIGNDCNAKASFQSCRACNSTNSVNCIRSPNTFVAVLCDDYLDECYTHVENNVVTRGCLATTTPAVQERCGSNGELCETCSNGPSCNNRIVDGEFCIECRSELDPNCRTALNHTMREQCPLSVNPRGCYFFDDGGEQQVRGCVANLISEEEEMCKENGQFCKTCVGNDCNAKVSFTSCKTCNSAVHGLACIRSATGAPSVTCRDYLDECVSHVFDDVVTRGCLAEINVTRVQDDCAGTANSDFCHKCSNTRDCNTGIVDGEFCITCDSDTDPNCLANTNHTMRVQCPLGVEQRGCYRFDDGATVKRGCVASIHPDEVEMCRRQENQCKTCIGNDCNQKPSFQRCRSCSSATSVNCIRSPNSFAAVTCRNYLDTCYTHVENDIVTRGCLSVTGDSVPAQCSANEGDLCETCDGENCNNRIVDGEFCLTCDTATDPLCRTSANFTMRTQCQLAVRPRGCYLFDDGGDTVKRGCVSDIHPDEITMCRGRQSPECKTCIGNDCNEKPTFQYCRTCNSSTSVNCIRSPGSFASQLCLNYADECYTHVENDVVTRGCLATGSAAVQQTCQTNPDLCHTCSSGANCNNRIVDGEFCLTCDAATDPTCRDTPDFTLRTQCPLATQQRGCYLFDDGGDVVKRGCVADITPEEIAMCRRQGDECKTCIGNDCNQKAHFQRCKTCNSSEDVNCIRSVVNWIGSETCTNYADECFVHVQNNTILRGCLDENAHLAQACTDPNVCETCDSRQDCNDKIVDGEFCITCNEETDSAVNCRSGVNFTLRQQCSLSVTPLGCYHHELADNKVARGCISDLTPDQQSACHEGESCQICVGNDCNVLETVPSCVVCDSATDANCVDPIDDSRVRTCQSYGDQCFTHIDGERVRRGCLLDEPEITAQCATDNGLRCEVCEGGNCNRRNVAQEFCYSCNSTVDANCATSVDVGQPKACTNEQFNLARRGCYRWENEDATVLRGCVNELPIESQNVCNAQGSCKTCDGNECNNKATFQTCLQCDSTNDPNCLELLVASEPTECRNYLDSCKTLINAEGKTVRGCTSDLLGVQTTVDAECIDNNCNGGIFPADRVKCYQCSGEGCADELRETSSINQYCANYVRDDECYGFTDAAGLMNRGCLSDDNATRCNEVDSRCSFCSGFACNGLAQYQPSSLSCIQCSGTEECKWGFQASSASPCASLIGYGFNQTCYTVETATLVRRGCQVELDVETCTSDDCRLCSEEGCNRNNVVVQTCQQCESNVDGQSVCSETDVIGFEQTCSASNEIVEYHNRGCFTKNIDNVISRGCASSLTAEEVENCSTDENNECDWCEGLNCNTKTPPSFANGLHAVSLLVLLLFASMSLLI